MMNSLRISVVALALLFAGTMLPNQAEALLPQHDCNFCHSLHGGTSSLVPLDSPTNLDVLCMSCHLTANGNTDAVQPHRSDGDAAAFHVGCTDCHEVHDNMENWRFGDPTHIDTGTSGTEGINQKMIGREDPEGDTPYAIILTREKDYNQNGIPDRGTVTQTCNTAIMNDCYTTERRYVIFEQAVPATSLHAWADSDADGKDPIVENPADPIAIQTNESDSGALSSQGKNWSAYDSLCQMCHTQTSKHNLLTGAQIAHNPTSVCTDCHVHDGCFDKSSVCTKWSVPNRDLQVDTVTALPASVNSGQTVTITVDVSNLGDDTETIQVKYSSDIEGHLGYSSVAGVAPGGGTAQTFLDWITNDGGTHTLTAEIVPVVGELVTGNNNGTDSVTVIGADQHDVAITSVSSPTPIHQGDTETVSVGLENLGDFEEGPFDVTLSSDLDGLIDTVSSGILVIGATPTLNFSWDTTGATLGTHLLTATFATFTDDVPGNDSADTTAVVAIHDVAVTSVNAPPSVNQGSVANVTVDIANLSSSNGFSETFNVTLYDNTDDSGHASPIDTLSSGLLAAQGSTQLSFNWDTTGASLGTHTLEAIAETVTGETITANNTDTTTADVIVPVTHDVGVVQIQAIGDVEQGTTEVVLVDVWNYGGATETFDVNLSSNQDGSIDSPQSAVSLASGTGTTVSFSWVTNGSTTVGAHTLTATTALGTDSNATNDTATTGATILEHDLSVISVTDTPDPVTQGGTVTVEATISNIGDYAETFNVTLTSDQDGLLHTWTSVSLGVGATTTPALTYPWDTASATVATHTLTANAVAVTNEFITANNSADTSVTVNTAAAVHDLAVIAITTVPASPINTCGSRSDIQVNVTVENQGTATETNFSVGLNSDQSIDGIFSDQIVSSLGPAGTTDVNFTWTFKRNATCVDRNFTADVDPVTGETDTADNVLVEVIEIN